MTFRRVFISIVCAICIGIVVQAWAAGRADGITAILVSVVILAGLGAEFMGSRSG